MILNKNSFFGDRKNRRLIIATLSVLLTGSIVYHFLEGWNWIDSIYFSVITLTTVGYGDFSPQTDLGKIFTIFYVLTGISILFAFINTLFQYRSLRPDRKKNNRSENK